MSPVLGRRRRTSLTERLAALEAVAEAGRGRLDPEDLARVDELLARAGDRLRLAGDRTVVALAGATGSGKSSLFNALAGEELSPAEVRRPTTGVTHACVWGEGDAEELLDWLGVAVRHDATDASGASGASGGDERLDGLVLLDLPDHDSTVDAHRVEVDRLVGLVDLLVWVVDPQKYADAALHERYLQPLASHASIMVVALNHADRLDGASLRVCLDDLRALLDSEGLSRARLLPTSARTGDGVDALRDVLATAVARHAAASDRISADLDALVADLSARVGNGGDGRVGRAEAQRLTAALGRAAGVPAIVDGVERAVRERALAAAGWPPAQLVRRMRPNPLRRVRVDGGARLRVARTALPPATPVARAQVDDALRGVADAASKGLPDSWRRATRTVVLEQRDPLVAEVDAAVDGTDFGVRARPWWVPLLAPLQRLVTLAALAGLVWLGAAFVVDWLRLPSLPTYDVQGFALPTLLLLGGVVAGLLIAGLARLLAGMSARRAGRQAERHLRELLAASARTHVLDPVAAEASAHSRLVDALTRAGGR